MPEITRFSTPQAYIQAEKNMFHAGVEMERASRRATDQKKFQRASDDPRAAHEIYLSGSEATALRQIKDNLKLAEFKVNHDYGNIESIKKVLDDIRISILRGANSATTSDSEYESLQSQVNSAKDQLLMIANGKDSFGNYIFAGLQSQDKPFDFDEDGNLQYYGDTSHIKIQVAADKDVEVGTVLGEDFVRLYNIVDAVSKDMKRDSATGLSQDLEAFDTEHQKMINLMGLIGGKQQEITRYTRNNEQQILRVTSRVSEIQEVDMSELIMDMTKTSQKMQLVVQVLGEKRRIESLSLLD